MVSRRAGIQSVCNTHNSFANAAGARVSDVRRKRPRLTLGFRFAPRVAIAHSCAPRTESIFPADFLNLGIPESRNLVTVFVIDPSQKLLLSDSHPLHRRAPDQLSRTRN